VVLLQDRQLSLLPGELELELGRLDLLIGDLAVLRATLERGLGQRDLPTGSRS
jgi:hypothetical protein